jgi:hypothetical protein
MISLFKEKLATVRFESIDDPVNYQSFLGGDDDDVTDSDVRVTKSRQKLITFPQSRKHAFTGKAEPVPGVIVSPPSHLREEEITMNQFPDFG